MEFSEYNRLTSQRQFAPKCSFLVSGPLTDSSFRISWQIPKFQKFHFYDIITLVLYWLRVLVGMDCSWFKKWKGQRKTLCLDKKGNCIYMYAICIFQYLIMSPPHPHPSEGKWSSPSQGDRTHNTFQMMHGAFCLFWSETTCLLKLDWFSHISPILIMFFLCVIPLSLLDTHFVCVLANLFICLFLTRC